MVSRVECDVLVVGGGVAGLWTANALRDQGWSVLLVEASAYGDGQSTQAQGIVHGGGKYALRSVGDVAAIAAIRRMPQRWREHHAGRRLPDLSAARKLSDHCWLWLPRAGWKARWEAATFMQLLRHGGLLEVRPEKVARAQWPPALGRSAHAVYRMAEPVFEVRSVLEALSESLGGRGWLGRVTTARRDEASQRWSIEVDSGSTRSTVSAAAVVLTAGAGNESLAALFGGGEARMQRRPLMMALLRGDLPALHGHCVAGGRTRMTITSVETARGDVVWQLGGEVAERNAGVDDPDAFAADVVRELGAVLPGMDLKGASLSSYVAVRAEGANAEQKRPSGVHVEEIAPAVLVAWPTKWAMAPLLAEEVVTAFEYRVPRSPEGSTIENWPRPEVAEHPWEDVEWRPVDLARAV